MEEKDCPQQKSFQKLIIGRMLVNFQAELVAGIFGMEGLTKNTWMRHMSHVSIIKHTCSGIPCI